MACPHFDLVSLFSFWSFTAAAEHGLRIMAMLYLTPILPLGPVSYMCGTTSMALSSFVIAKIAALPLMMLYVFIGASTGALIGKDAASAAEVKSIEENEYLIALGILLSFVMIACITRHIKKELNKVRSPLFCLRSRGVQGQRTVPSGERQYLMLAVVRAVSDSRTSTEAEAWRKRPS